MKKIIHYLRPYIPLMCLGLTIKFIGTIMDLALPWILSYIIDDVVPRGSKTGIFLWGGAMILCAAVSIVGNISANRIAAKVSRNTTERIRHDLFARTMRLSCSQSDRFTLPSLISRLTSDTYNVHHMFSMMQRRGVRAPILLVGGICVTITLEPVLTLVLVAVLPLLALVVWLVSRHVIPLYTLVQNAIDKIVRKVQENITGVRVIKALSKSDYERARFDEINKDAVKREQRAGMVTNITSPVMNLLLNGGLTAVIVVGAFRVN
ncbi:MAG TPA: ABC transporter permease, partial [Clostridiales bacterium]|nr:ABC transporter permease [Clostridiales bacterium]